VWRTPQGIWIAILDHRKHSLSSTWSAPGNGKIESPDHKCIQPTFDLLSNSNSLTRTAYPVEPSSGHPRNHAKLTSSSFLVPDFSHEWSLIQAIPALFPTTTIYLLHWRMIPPVRRFSAFPSPDMKISRSHIPYRFDNRSRIKLKLSIQSSRLPPSPPSQKINPVSSSWDTV
jgi:hypothetical protein